MSTPRLEGKPMITAATTLGANPYDQPASPSIASATSSLCNGINVLIELIRKNNSDFSEPHLFHTTRNRLIILQQQQRERRSEDMNGHGEEETRLRRETGADASVSVDGKGIDNSVVTAKEEEHRPEQDAMRDELEAAMNEIAIKWASSSSPSYWTPLPIGSIHCRNCWPRRDRL